MPSAAVLSAIGDTPLVRLRALAPENGAELAREPGAYATDQLTTRT